MLGVCDPCLNGLDFNFCLQRKIGEVVSVFYVDKAGRSFLCSKRNIWNRGRNENFGVTVAAQSRKTQMFFFSFFLCKVTVRFM